MDKQVKHTFNVGDLVEYQGIVGEVVALSEICDGTPTVVLHDVDNWEMSTVAEESKCLLVGGSGAHTPGEWGSHSSASNSHTAICSKNLTLIALVNQGKDGNAIDKNEARANAHLIAAAPCQNDALLQWKRAEETGDKAEMENARKSRDAALAKAGGES